MNANPNVTPEMLTALQDALREDAPWGASIIFLDSINSVEVLDALAPHLSAANVRRSLVEFYRENLIRWADPQLSDEFKEKCPLLSARLDTPQKVRILLRGADFRDVSPLLMGEVLEEIIRRHEVGGEKKVVYEKFRGDLRCQALRIVYHTQLQAWTLVRLAIPGYTSIGAGTNGLFIDWRTKDERIQEGHIL